MHVQRGTLLGETPLPSKPRSVFDFLSQKDRERLEKVKDAIQHGDVPSRPSEPPPPTHTYVPGELVIPDLHPSTAKAALSGFQPFTADPLKHARYTTFLAFASSAASDRQLGMGPQPGQTIDDFNKELADYAKSAAVFKPLSAAMASRFQTASIVEMGPNVVEGLHTPEIRAPSEPAEEETPKEEWVSRDPKAAAARAGMYGPLTRNVTPWQPAQLLCKRFGVKMPEVDISTTDSASAAGPRPHGSSVPEQGPSTTSPLAITDGSTGAAPSGTADLKKGPRDLANIGLGEDAAQGQDTLTYQRPAMDVFKAIFASDDEESDDEAEENAESAPAAPAPGLSGVKVESEDVPVPLAAGDSAPTSYVPTGNGAGIKVEENVDAGTFKPTFVPRAEREGHKDTSSSSKSKEKEKEKARKEKKRKEKHGKTLVSFDTEDGEEGLRVVPRKRKEKHRSNNRDKDGDDRGGKKRKEAGADGADDDSMWVEAPAPAVVQHLGVAAVSGATPQEPTLTPTLPSTTTMTATPSEHINDVHPTHRPRKRAVDFM